MTQYRLKAKIFHTHHGHGRGLRFLDKSHALYGGEEGRFEVRTPRGRHLSVREGDYLDPEKPNPQIGPVRFDKRYGCLHAGNYAIPLGQVTPGWRARPLGRKRQFLVERVNAETRPFTVTLGEAVRPQPGLPEECVGKVPYLDEYQNLQLGISVKPAQKEYELNLIVLDKPERGGYMAYFNLLEPGSSSNRSDGVKGIFYPPKADNQPAAFCEVAVDNNKVYRTALFWKTSNNRYASGQYRPVEAAIEERHLYEHLKEVKQLAEELGTQAAEMGLDTSEAEQKLEQYNRDWTQALFTVFTGHEFMFPAPSPQRDPEGHSPRQYAP